MIFHYFKTLPSTQSFLEKLEPKEPSLVSTLIQTEGKGRGKNVWIQKPSGICFSFSFHHSENIPWSLITGIILCQFLKKYFHQNFFLKWPNDILTSDGVKIGGILITKKKSLLIIGIGLNINPGISINASAEKLSFVFPQLFYKFFFKQNLKKSLAFFHSFCYHMNEIVQIDDTEGTFKGITQEGYAVLEHKGTSITISTGSLWIKKS